MISTTALGQQQSGRCAQQLGLQSLGGATGETGRMRERGRGRGRGTERQTDRERDEDALWQVVGPVGRWVDYCTPPLGRVGVW